MAARRKLDRKVRTTITAVWLLSFVFCCGGSAFAHGVFFGGHNSIWGTHSLWDILDSAEWGLANGFIAAMFVGICGTAVSGRRWLALVVVISGSAIALSLLGAEVYHWLLHAG